MEISQDDLTRLIEEVRELRSRVERLERILNVAASKHPSTDAASSSPTSPEIDGARSERLSARSAPLLLAPKAGPDLEARIGSHWLNRLGIAAFLTAVSYFLKFAFDNNWIGPPTRVAIGLSAGLGVVLWSERFRRGGYQIFSYSLKAVGIGALYLSLWASFQIYHLLSSGVVFSSMVVVTASACGLALAEDAEVLAWFAIAGGFSTPVLLSTGENREIALFSYLVLLDLGILALMALKPWRRILFLGWGGTGILFASWYVEFYDRAQLPPTFTFATSFFVIFALGAWLGTSREGAGGISGATLAVLNALTYFVQCYIMLMAVNRHSMAELTFLVAGAYLLLARLGQRSRASSAAVSLGRIHLVLAFAFVTIAIAIRLDNYWVTLGWFLEAGLLLFLPRRWRSDDRIVFAALATVLGIFRLLLIDTFAPAHLLCNMRICVHAAAIALSAALARNAAKGKNTRARNLGRLAAVVMNALALRALCLEVSDYYSKQLVSIHNLTVDEAGPGAQQVRAIEIARGFTYSALGMAYGGILMVIGFWRGSAFIRWQALVVVALATGKIFVYDTSQLDRLYRILSFSALGILLLAISFAYQRNWLRFASTNASSVQPEPEP